MILKNTSIIKRAAVPFLKLGVVIFGFILPIWLLACIGYPDCIIPWYLAAALLVASIGAACFCTRKMNRIEQEDERNRRMCRRYADTSIRNEKAG